MKKIETKKLLAIALAQFSFFLLLQLENFFLLDGMQESSIFFSILFSQVQSILISLAFVLLYSALSKYNSRRVIVIFLLGTLGLYLCFNQIFFSIFFDQFRPSYSEGVRVADFAVYWDSFLKELNFTFFINILILFFGLFKLNKFLKAEQSVFIYSPVHKISSIIFILVNLVSGQILDGKNINSHPLLTVIQFKASSQSKILLKDQDIIKDLQTLRHGSSFSDPTTQEKTTKFLKNALNRKQKPNVIFILLESVGGLQLFPKGKIDSRQTPFLAKIMKGSIAFHNIYNTFPATTRSHIPIMTGGPTITWGSVNNELLYSYQGPTIVSALKSHDYIGAWFSAMFMDFENLGNFYKNLGFSKVYDPGFEKKAFVKKNSIHSWGIDEKIIFDKAAKWIKSESQKVQPKPYFLQLLTNTTHHPYGAPTGFQTPYKGTSKFDHYRQALYYTDHQIGQFISKLRSQGQLKNTLLFICGDHGEAFGKRHKRNFTHKNFLYEENIRNFLMVTDFDQSDAPIYSGKRGHLADIAPTIIELTGGTLGVSNQGQNLFLKEEEKLHFFHKNIEPEQWGLRDGQFKFIAQKVGVPKPQLYDLTKDPLENNNIASSFPKRVEQYQKLIASWYITINKNFSKNLKDFKYADDGGLKISDITAYGPKRIAFGIKIKGESFKTLKLIHPNEDMSVWTQGVAYPKNKKLNYRFTSPEGKTKKFNFEYSSDWSTVYVSHGQEKPMDEGTWDVQILDAEKLLLTKTFQVSKQAELNIDRFNKKSGIRYISFGAKKSGSEYRQLNKINPNEDFVVQVLLNSYSKNKKFYFVWTSPKGKKKSFNFTINKGWNKAWVDYSPSETLSDGKWSLSIFDDSERSNELIKKDFYISSSAPLFNRF